MLKPLATQEPVRSRVVQMLRRQGDITAKEKTTVTQEQIEEHYQGIAGEPHFSPITRYLTGKEVEVIVLEGDGEPGEFVGRVRKLVGCSDPAQCQEGQIRHLAVEMGLPYTVPMEPVNGSNNYCRDNLVHCSDSPDAAAREVEIWFNDLDVLWRYSCLPKSRSSTR